MSVFLGFHCSDNGFDQGRARGSGITDGGGGGGGGSVTGNFVKDTGSGNDKGSRCDRSGSGVGGSGHQYYYSKTINRVVVVLVLMLAVICDQCHFQQLS